MRRDSQGAEARYPSTMFAKATGLYPYNRQHELGSLWQEQEVPVLSSRGSLNWIDFFRHQYHIMYNVTAHKRRVDGVLAGHPAKPSEGRPPHYFQAVGRTQLLTELPPLQSCGMGFNVHWKTWGMQLGHCEPKVSAL